MVRRVAPDWGARWHSDADTKAITLYHSSRKPKGHTQLLIRFSAQVFMSHVSGRSGRTASSSATFKLPPLSPAFLTEEDAAYWVHTRIPLNPDKEYGSVILLRPDGKFLATSPIAGEATRFDFGTIVQTDALGGMLHPLGYRCIASVHSHPPLHDQFRNGNRRQDETLLRLFMSFYSGGDVIGDVSARDFFRSAYLSGPDGSLLKYVSSGSPEERDYFLWQ